MKIQIILNSWHYPGDALHCHFASGIVRKSLWERVQEMTGGWVSNKAELEHFTQQVRDNKHIVLHGGDTPTLIRLLSMDKTWISMLNGKTIHAISAGVGALALRSFNIDHRKVISGLGVIPYQTIVHYRPDMKWMADELYKNCALPVLAVSDDVAYRVVIDGFHYKLEEYDRYIPKTYPISTVG